MTAWRAVTLVASFSLALAACSHDQGPSSSNANIGIQTNQLFVTVEDDAGTALSDVNVAIQAPGAPPYTHLITRLEAGEKRDVSLSDFSSRDGTTFSLRMLSPRSVRVSATDMTGKSYNAEVAWKQ